MSGCFRCGPTLTVLLVRLVSAVCFAVAASLSIDAAPFITLELEGGADGTVVFITAVVTLGVTVAAPDHRNAVDLASGTGELLRGAGGRL